MKQKLLIIRGLPGSGKSTLGQKLAPGQVYEADQFRYNDKGEYIFDPSKNGEAHEKCFNATKQALLSGELVVAVCNTFIKRWEYMKYVNLAKELGVEYEIIVCTGKWNNIHGVDEETIARMKKNWEK